MRSGRSRCSHNQGSGGRRLPTLPAPNAAAHGVSCHHLRPVSDGSAPISGNVAAAWDAAASRRDGHLKRPPGVRAARPSTESHDPNESGTEPGALQDRCSPPPPGVFRKERSLVTSQPGSPRNLGGTRNLGHANNHIQLERRRVAIATSDPTVATGLSPFGLPVKTASATIPIAPAVNVKAMGRCAAFAPALLDEGMIWMGPVVTSCPVDQMRCTFHQLAALMSTTPTSSAQFPTAPPSSVPKRPVDLACDTTDIIESVSSPIDLRARMRVDVGAKPVSAECKASG